MTLQAAKEDIQKIIFGMNLVHFNPKKLLCVFQVLDQIKRRMTKNPPPPKKKKKRRKRAGGGGGEGQEQEVQWFHQQTVKLTACSK